MTVPSIPGARKTSGSASGHAPSQIAHRASLQKLQAIPNEVATNKTNQSNAASSGRHDSVRYENGLLYALDKPWFSFAGAEPLCPEPHDKAAALMETLIRTHPFVDGNKRTAYVAGITLLRYLTGERVEASPEEALSVCQSVERKD